MRLNIFAFLVFSFSQSYSYAQEVYTVSRSELAFMPPYCTALQGKHHGMPQPQDSPLRHTIPAGCPAVHHYCDALKFILRANRTMGSKRKNFGYSYNVQNAITILKDVTEEWRGVAPSCSLRAEAHTNLAKSLLRMGKQQPAAVSQAINNLNQAIYLSPSFVRSYLALTDLYIDIGEKEKAKKIIEEGFVHIPNSKALTRRYVKLGGKPSDIKSVEKLVPATVEENDSASKASHPIEVKPIEEKSIEETPAEPKPVSNTVKELSAPKNGSQKSPYCRFCPED